jgi:putative ABC transport system ATP-binding protein
MMGMPDPRSRRASAVLELVDVVKHYRASGEEIRAVDGVSLAVSPGEMVAIVGPSGSGKTTLLLLIAALLAPERGSVSLDGRDLASLSETQVCDYLLTEVGFIYQNYHLMPRVSAVENAALKLVLGGMGMREAQRRAFPWLERVGLAQRIYAPPELLSGGERQRVAIARALTGEPRLILADEPTGNLDSARSAHIVRLLHSIAHERGAIVVLVTHDAEAAALADRCYALRDGKLRDVSPRSGADPGNGSHAAPEGGPGAGAPHDPEANPDSEARRPPARDPHSPIARA